MLSFLTGIAGRIFALLGALFLLWFALSGYFDKATLVMLGAFSVLITVWLCLRSGVMDGEGVPTRVFPGIVSYMLWLTLEIGKANLAVAREVVRPKMRLSPRMIRVKAHQTSDLGKTIFGNSITLTPGTVTVDLTSTGEVLVHALSDDFAEDLGAIEDMGARVCAFDGPEGREWAAQRALAEERS
ncbi:hypothetical protein PB2503_03242 [Parvularcula bermudensis HTCC2503]|uniref:Cation antiporter n=1 Tax=Parvularcula bermudensis (strain ATCC BAA-594 / HTCC2503 / KCTC 12087) TaxID=314260 RepID=E0TD66_PARBH|nr:Na+/H+ antiporter subunit E [Parvularcula bermudensis]ADM08725.1 hypothetical protein PB2503_03242 [Parvularcula bermudensis HTCC2503]